MFCKYFKGCYLLFWFKSVFTNSISESIPFILSAILNATISLSAHASIELLDANENFLPHMKFFINGREAVYLPDKFDTIIQPDDKVDIFPPVGGG